MAVFSAPSRTDWLPPRPGFFAALILACGVGGLCTSMIEAGGAGAAQVNWIVVLAVFLCLRAVLLAPGEAVRGADLVTGGAALVLLIVPQPDSSWLALSLIGIYLLWSEAKGSRLWSGGVLALAVTVPTLWARLVPLFFAAPLERIDLYAVALITGGTPNADFISFQQGPGGIVVAWACTSFANAAFSLLLWVALTRTVRPMPVRGEGRSLALVLASVFCINTVRLAVMDQSYARYEMAHGPVGAFWVNMLLIASTLAWTIFGLRRELLR